MSASLVTALGVVFLGVGPAGVGVLAVEVLRAAYRTRNWPLSSSGGALTAGGKRTERRLGYVRMPSGTFVCLAGVVVLIPGLAGAGGGVGARSRSRRYRRSSERT